MLLICAGGYLGGFFIGLLLIMTTKEGTSYEIALQILYWDILNYCFYVNAPVDRDPYLISYFMVSFGFFCHQYGHVRFNRGIRLDLFKEGAIYPKNYVI